MNLYLSVNGSLMIIGRKAEIQRLENIYTSKNAEFAVLYGRRRVGKTFLIRQFFQDKKGIFFQVTGLKKGTLKKQLTHFAASLSETLMHGVPVKPPSSWEEAFKDLTQLINVTTKAMQNDEKITIFLDELPWLATRRSGLLETLDYYWNHHWVKNSNIILIVCGSSASWLIKNIIYNQAGLHNRCTAEMQLFPFNLTETQDFLFSRHIHLNKTHILDLYMAFGGIPYYLTYIKKGLTASENIQTILCGDHAPLKGEFDKLFDSLFTNAAAHKELMQLIASKKDGISRKTLEKQATLSAGGGRLSSRLKQLEQTHFIASYIPWEKERGEYYKVIDEFCLFYFFWLKGNKSKQRVDNFWMLQIQKPIYQVWAGYAFEAICHKHIHSIIRALGISTAESISTWHTNKTADLAGTQIDLLIDRSDDAITLCEIKYTDKPFVIHQSYLDILKTKIEVFKATTKTHKQIFMALISANGLKTNIFSSEIIDATATLDDLFT